MSAVRRTATTDETQGFMKVLVGASDDRILGFTMIGAEAGEVMADGANGDAGGSAVSEAARRHSRAPDDGGGTGFAVRECTAAIRYLRDRRPSSANRRALSDRGDAQSTCGM